ncbi:MAG TPA: HAD family hydrolase [Dehalococcoidia bacterium]|nr:HAD family hydrolase [Dehalococcoidia bacterium]
MKAVKAIFFDFDNTLVDDDACLRIALERVAGEIGAHLAEEVRHVLSDTYRGISDAFWLTTPSVDDIAGTRLRLWREALTSLGCLDDLVAAAARDAYQRHRMEICEPYEETLEVIELLSQRYRLAIISNGGDEQQRSRLKFAGMAHHFELVVTSDLGVGKPHPAIFEHALSQLRLDPAAVWHVGDRLDADVLGAHNAGLTSVWLNRTGASRTPDHPEPHHEIASLRELMGLLDL